MLVLLSPRIDWGVALPASPAHTTPAIIAVLTKAVCIDSTSLTLWPHPTIRRADYEGTTP